MLALMLALMPDVVLAMALALALVWVPVLRTSSSGVGPETSNA